VTIRAASSVIIRRGPSDPRVFLVQRNPVLRFFGGYWAFTGGTVSDADREGSGPVEGVERDMRPFVHCAARECLEELGVDLSVTSTPEPRTDEVVKRARESILDDADAYGPWLRERDASVPGDRFFPLGRLLTPPHHPVRYDTQFFLVDLSEWSQAGDPMVWPGELVDGAWREPSEWLETWRRGDVLIAPPVLLILEMLDRLSWREIWEQFQALARTLADADIHTIFYSPALQLIPLETPTLPPATHTNAFLVGSDPAYLIDPATPHEKEQRRLARVLDEALDDRFVSGRHLEAILLTHYHPDHVGAVEFVRNRHKVPVWAHSTTHELLAGSIQIDRVLEDGDRLPLGVIPDGQDGWELEVYHTPGHAPGHLSFFERRYGSLIAGDMISTLSSILIDPSDGDMAVYMRSLERLIELPSRLVYPSHGPPASTGPRALEEQHRHRIGRESAIFEAITAGATDIGEVVSRVYEETPEELLEHASLSVTSVCRKLSAEGRIRIAGDRLEPAD